MASAAITDAERAWQTAIRYLKRREHSESQVRNELALREFSPADIDATIGRLQRHRYLDDRRFAAEMAERLARRGHGSLRARRDLAQAGIGAALIDEVVERVFAHEDEMAKQVVAARYRPPLTPIDRGRAGRFLLGRGFPEDLVQCLIGSDE